MWILDPEWAEQNGGDTDKTAKLLHLSLFSSRSHFVQQMNNSLDLLKPAELVQILTMYNIEWTRASSRSHRAQQFFKGVSRGGPYRWSMDRSVRWSVDPVRWTGPRTGVQCFRVTPSISRLWASEKAFTVKILSAFRSLFRNDFH